MPAIQWKLVPVDPTPEMGMVYGYVLKDTGSSYDAMKAAIAAAPETAQQALADELDLIRAVLDGYLPGMARNDALWSVSKIMAALSLQSQKDSK